MSAANDHSDPLDATERALADRLSRLPQAEPSAELDARVLAAARAAVVQRRAPRWGWGMGAAAAAVLCVGVFLPLWKEAQSPPPLLDESALTGPSSTEGAVAPARQAAPSTLQEHAPAPATINARSERDQPLQQATDTGTPPTDGAPAVLSVAPASESQSATSAKASAPDPASVDSIDAASSAPSVNEALPPPAPPAPAAPPIPPAAPAAAAPVSVPQSAQARDTEAERRRLAPLAAGQTTQEALAAELTAIRALLAAGERDAAARRLRALLEHHPSVELDAELRPLLELPP